MPPPTRHAFSAQIFRSSGSLAPALHRGVEIDELHLREGPEPVDPGLPVVGGQREALALNELHDLAVTEIDCGNQHEVGNRESGIGTG